MIMAAKVLEIDQPNEKQKLFFLSRKRFIGYGGARGGGKSWGLRTKAVLLCCKYKKLKVLLLRKTYPELMENHIKPLLSLLNGVATYKVQDKEFIFPNGSRIKLGYCNLEKDIYQYQGQEYDVIMIEECTHFTWEMVQFLMTSNRSTREDFKPRMYFTGNPGGVGHNWFKRLFIKKRYKATEHAEDYEFIPATVDDNTILMERNPEYVEILDNLPEKLRKAHRFGDWDVFEGQFFEEFTDKPEHYKDRMNTHVIEPFNIPQDWEIYRSFDFGYAKPFSFAWWAVDYDGRLYRILELYGCVRDRNTGEDIPNEGVKWTPEKMFEEVKRIENEHKWLKGKRINGIADPSIWDGSRGKSINSIANEYGIYFQKGINDRLPGWMQVHYRFAFDNNGIPMMYVFSTCTSFIRTMPGLQYDQHKIEDLDTTGEDHIADETRYMCMARPIVPEVSQNDYDKLGDDPLHLRKGR